MTTKTTETENMFSDELKKVKLKCSKCNEEFLEFYTKGAIIRDVICKACYQIDKLKE